MKALSNIFIFLIPLLLVGGCNKQVTVNELLTLINGDPDFTKEYADEIYKVTCTFKPAEILALTELRSHLNKGGSIPGSLFEKTKKDFSNAAYFGLNIRLTDGANIITSIVSSKVEYANVMNYLTSHLNRNVYILTDEKDTIKAIIYDFQRSYGMSPNANFLFTFPKLKGDKLKIDDFDLVYDDKLFGINKPLKFRFNSNILSKTFPDIKEIKKEK